jgi:uncharacterized protein YjhX (UPF0386 family)
MKLTSYREKNISIVWCFPRKGDIGFDLALHALFKLSRNDIVPSLVH